MDGHLINGIGITSYLCGKNEILIFHIIQNKLKGLNEKKKNLPRNLGDYKFFNCSENPESLE